MGARRAALSAGSSPAKAPITALGWCVALFVLGYVLSRRLFDRRAEL